MSKTNESQDPTAESRKQDHISLAFESQVDALHCDQRFDYEPMLAGHPANRNALATQVLGFDLALPIWVSSMTGGTQAAHTINHNLARACGQYGMGMGLGSCRALLYDESRLADFDVKHLMPEQPLYANLGIAQVQNLLDQGQSQKLHTLLSTLNADGLIVHVNPLQEWLQPEGDRYHASPIATLEALLQETDHPIIVKEVGQGFGPASMKALLQLPLQAIDFAASGGTNFALLELLRSDEYTQAALAPLSKVGHSYVDMIHIYNKMSAELGDKQKCQEVIISGGIKTFLDGYHAIQSISAPAIYGQASAFLKHAQGDYGKLETYIETQIKGLEAAYAFLSIKTARV